MEIEITAIRYIDNKNIELIPIHVNEERHKLVIKKLENERNKIISYLKSLKIDGEIKSIFRPKNKKLQENLDYLCRLKKEIKRNIEKLKTIYQ